MCKTFKLLGCDNLISFLFFIIVLHDIFGFCLFVRQNRHYEDIASETVMGIFQYFMTFYELSRSIHLLVYVFWVSCMLNCKVYSHLSSESSVMPSGKQSAI